MDKIHLISSHSQWASSWRLLLFLMVVCCCAGTLFEDYERCRDGEQFGQRPNGTLVCDPDGRLQPKAVEQLESMLEDLERNIPCDCADGCGRTGGNEAKGDKFMALLLVANQERVEQTVETEAGIDGLNQTARRVWDNAGMGDDRCDNGMLLIYVRDQKQMVTYQGHAAGRERFKVFSDQQIANLHELAMNGPLGDFGGASSSDDNSGAEVRKADENWAPVLGLSLALALTFLVLIILLALLLAKCCRMCCQSPARKASKYYVNPMPGYKSIEPIYIVTPAGSEAAAYAPAPPSATSLYGTGPYGGHHHPPPMMHPHAHHHHGIYGPPPPPPPGPVVHHPRSRSITPTSTQRIHRTYHGGTVPSGANGQHSRTAQSIQSTPEANKRDKVNRTMTVRSNGTGTYYTASQQNTPDSAFGGGGGGGGGGSSPKKKISNPPPTIHETELPDHHQHHPHHHHEQQHPIIHPQSSATSSSLSQPPPPLPFLDPWRKQEVQTREEFIG